jgi:hypothetical protein
MYATALEESLSYGVKIPNDSAIEYTRTYNMKRPSNIGGQLKNAIHHTIVAAQLIDVSPFM